MAPESISLVASIRQRQQEGLLPVISEVKVSSPKEGDLMLGRDPIALGRTMCSCPIAGLSVIIEGGVWGGSPALIEQLRPDVSVPILAKCMHKTSEDLKISATAGANAALLVVCMLDDEQLMELHESAKGLGLETLVEVHTEDELKRVMQLGIQADILGINNRDIAVGEVDDGNVSVTERLSAMVPTGTVVLSASSIEGPDDARRARDAGADVVLVGTSILRASDTVKAIEDLVAVGWNASKG